MYVLLTNDDGVDSEGLLKLKAALGQVAEVAVIAPEQNWSAVGHTKTLRRPLCVRRIKLPDGDLALVTDGTPSDCVALGLLGLLPRRPDLVIAGINKGPNLGDDITYSGTVAAAMEGIIGGVPSIAVSLDAYDGWDFAYAAEFTANLAVQVVRRRLSAEVLLNVNVPNLPCHKIQGVEITRLGKRVYQDILVEEAGPDGSVHYWIRGDPPGGLLVDGTDIHALAQGKISITPIHLDLTNHALIEELKNWELSG